jgi:hypothetical protein
LTAETGLLLVGEEVSVFRELVQPRGGVCGCGEKGKEKEDRDCNEKVSHLGGPLK